QARLSGPLDEPRHAVLEHLLGRRIRLLLPEPSARHTIRRLARQRTEELRRLFALTDADEENARLRAREEVFGRRWQEPLELTVDKEQREEREPRAGWGGGLARPRGSHRRRRPRVASWRAPPAQLILGQSQVLRRAAAQETREDRILQPLAELGDRL